MVRRPVRAALQGAQAPVGQPRAAGEAGLEQLGAQVVVVEDELGPLQRRGTTSAMRPEDVRRVAGLDDREPAAAAGP